MIDWTILLLALPAVGAAGLTAFNIACWPRGAARRTPRQSVSVLMPARDEAQTIEGAVRSALAQPGVGEVLVYDDQSTDATPQILAKIARQKPRLRVVEGTELPAGWVGKPHACHRLAQEATGELLLFVDADVELQDGATSRLYTLLTDYEADAVTAVPHQRVGSFAERLVLPLLHLTYLSWLPLPLIWRTRDPRLLAANGQVLAVRRAAYDTVGGFRAVREAVVDDMEFCRALKASGQRVLFADGTHIAACRMYESPREVWEGFSKNIFEGIGSAAGLFAVFALYSLAFLLPWLLAALTPIFGQLLPAAALGIGANVAQRIALVVRYRHPWESVLLHPLSILAFFAIALNSWIWHLRGAIRWSGRSYAKRKARRG